MPFFQMDASNRLLFIIYYYLLVSSFNINSVEPTASQGHWAGLDTDMQICSIIIIMVRYARAKGKLLG